LARLSLPNQSPEALRPAEICQALLAALEASEGRRKKRKRDQTPDAIGLAIKRQLLQQVVQDDPSPDAFEEWLLRYCERTGTGNSSGSVLAMARTVLDEWRLAHSLDEFKSWLDRGAPSDDAAPDVSSPTKPENSAT
jgi:hypothetical protein